MRLFAIGDLHLGFAAAKPMDVFGPEWRDHAERLRRNWEARVGPADTVFLLGDLSWGLRPEEARPDLEFVGRLPGAKILIKGNHDYWWTSRRKAAALLPPGVRLLQSEAVQVGEGTVATGTRGWALPDTPGYTPARDDRILRREVERLRRGLAALDAADAPRRVCLLHFPPLYRDRRRTPFTELLTAARVDLCLYGHLHGPDRRLAFEGEWEGVRYRLVSADHVDFAPVEVTP